MDSFKCKQYIETLKFKTMLFMLFQNIDVSSVINNQMTKRINYYTFYIIFYLCFSLIITN